MLCMVDNVIQGHIVIFADGIEQHKCSKEKYIQYHMAKYCPGIPSRAHSLFPPTF